jgi:hypothetical protein
MELKRGGSGQTRTKGNEVAHGSTLARTVAEGPATRQGRGECGTGNRRRAMQGNNVQSGSVLRMTVFPLGELRPRPSWCAGGSRMVDIRSRRGEGNGRSPTSLQSAREEFGGGQVRANLEPRGSGEALMARQVGRRSYKAKVRTGLD